MRNFIFLAVLLFACPAVAADAPCTTNGCSFTNNILALHYGGSGTAPTILQGTGSGNSGTTTGLDASAHDSSFTISFTSGASPTASGIIATVTFGAAYLNAPHCTFSATTAGAAALNATSSPFETLATGTWILTAGSSGLTNGVTYGWSVQCEQ